MLQGSPAYGPVISGWSEKFFIANLSQKCTAIVSLSNLQVLLRHVVQDHEAPLGIPTADEGLTNHAPVTNNGMLF